MAAQIGQQEIVTLLLAHGADPTITTKVKAYFMLLTYPITILIHVHTQPVNRPISVTLYC